MPNVGQLETFWDGSVWEDVPLDYQPKEGDDVITIWTDNEPVHVWRLVRSKKERQGSNVKKRAKQIHGNRRGDRLWMEGAEKRMAAIEKRMEVVSREVGEMEIYVKHKVDYQDARQDRADALMDRRFGCVYSWLGGLIGVVLVLLMWCIFK